MGKKKAKKTPSKREGDQMIEEASAQSSPQLSTSNRIVICSVRGCNDMATFQNRCRLHYLSNWRKMKGSEAKKAGLELEDYLSEMASRFPEEFFEKLRNELEDMSNQDSSDNDEKPSFFDQVENDDDMDTIIKGIKIEDY